jgi:Lectin C-type domain
VRRLAFAVLAVLAGLAGCTFERVGAKSDTDPPDAPKDDAAVDAAPVGDCPAGYEPLNGIGRYRVEEGADKSWQDAALDCNDDDDTGGPYRLFTHLVVLGNEIERTTITDAGTPITGNTWIGLSDLTTEGTYVWVSTEDTGGYPMLNMAPWDPGEPDNMGGNEDCVRFKNGYVLEDKVCGTAESYVCECDAFPLRPN